MTLYCLSHTSIHVDFVEEVAKHLPGYGSGGVFVFAGGRPEGDARPADVEEALRKCSVFVRFLGNSANRTDHELAFVQGREDRPKIFVVTGYGAGPLLPGLDREPIMTEWSRGAGIDVARKIVGDLDLPTNPHLFDYEKDIIEHYIRKRCLDRKADGPRWPPEGGDIERGILEGCPAEWPRVVRWFDGKGYENKMQDVVFRPDNAMVLAAALTPRFYAKPGLCMEQPDHSTEQLGPNHPRAVALREQLRAAAEGCIAANGFCFPEAGPRENLCFPRPDKKELSVAILVAGGIAPGINAVVDAITHRHAVYDSQSGNRTRVYGLMNGLRAFDNADTFIPLRSREPDGGPPGLFNGLHTSEHAVEGGSIIGTSRIDELLRPEERGRRLQKLVQQLSDRHIDILYVIGGDGGMKVAHAIWSIADHMYPRQLSVVAIPKSMDNDVLWVWQSFGFLSAVQKAKEVVAELATEIRSNPRLCVVQLFGSDSGFVVSHTVLASRTGACDAALIPEMKFSMAALARYLKDKMYARRHPIPYGLIVMAETAIPTDAEKYQDRPEIGLDDAEKAALKEFLSTRDAGGRIQGQTRDELRNAGLKIVSRGLKLLLQDPEIPPAGFFPVNWRDLRVFTNEPRHLLRAIAPSTSDIIMAQRLGTLAVDNAMAGYTDFMISQWLTEFVLVPLKLAVLGRKRIPPRGVFWQSVQAATGQPRDLVS